MRLEAGRLLQDVAPWSLDLTFQGGITGDSTVSFGTSEERRARAAVPRFLSAPPCLLP